MADSETVNNRKIAPALKFTSMTKNNSFTALSTSSSVSKPRLLTAPKSLGSSGAPRSLALSRTTGSAPSFSKLRESKSGDTEKSKSVFLTNSLKPGADNSNDLESSKQLNNLSYPEGKLIQNGPAFSYQRSSSWLKRPISQPSLQHVNSSPQLSTDARSESSPVKNNALQRDLGSTSSGLNIRIGKHDTHDERFDIETPNDTSSPENELSVSKLDVALNTSTVDQNQNIKGLSLLSDFSKLRKNDRTCVSDSVSCEDFYDRKWRTDLPDRLIDVPTQTSNISDKHGKGHNSGLSTSTADEDTSDREMMKGMPAVSKSSSDLDLELNTRRNEDGAEETEDSTPGVLRQGSEIFTSSANLVLSTGRTETQTDQHSSLQGRHKLETPQKQDETKTHQDYSIRQQNDFKPSTSSFQIKVDIKTAESPRKAHDSEASTSSFQRKVDIKRAESPRNELAQSKTHVSSFQENNKTETLESSFQETAETQVEDLLFPKRVGIQTSESSKKAKKSEPIFHGQDESTIPDSSFMKPAVESKVLKSSLKKKNKTVSYLQGGDNKDDEASKKSEQNISLSENKITHEPSDVERKVDGVSDLSLKNKSKCQVPANQDVNKTKSFSGSIEQPSPSTPNCKDAARDASLPGTSKSLYKPSPSTPKRKDVTRDASLPGMSKSLYQPSPSTLKGKDVTRDVSTLGTSKSLFPESMTLSMDLTGEEDIDEGEKDEGLSFSMSSTSSFMRGSDDTMSDITLSPPISPFNSPLRKDTASFVTSTPKSFIKSPNSTREERRHSLPTVESDLSENSSLKYSLVDIDLTNSYREKRPIGEVKSPNVTKSLSFSSGTPLAEALSLPTPSPRRKPRVSRRTSQKLIRMDDDEFIGFATLPDQVHRKAVKRGFEFGLMVVGETGLGKSTLINSLFLTDLYKDRKIPNVEETVKKTVQIEKKQLEIEERGVKLRLTIVDTPGFNDSVNGDENWMPIIDYIDNQFDQYYQAESGLNRKNIQDSRVHCCLYFISPYGHGLKPVDIAVMKRLHTKVNIVPLLAKSDILTPKEVKRLKAKILEEIKENHIQIYQFPECDSDEDEEFKQQDTALKAAIPFAVVGSNTVVEAGGKKIRGRMYPWGIVEVDNPKHCDFGKLRQMLISTHMQDLKDITADLHYENYRAEHLAEEMKSSQRGRSKLKRDSIVNLDAVTETDKLLQQKEAEIQRMQAMLAKMQAQLQSNQPQVNGKVANG